MRIIGRALIVAGLALAVWSVMMQVAIPLPGTGELIANNQLLNQRLLLAVLGGSTAICGFLALIVAEMKRG